MIFINKCFLFTVRSVCRVQRFITGQRNSLQGRSKVADDARAGAEVAERTVTKDFYAAGFDALVKRWDKCINVGGGYVEK
jgi:hypothetical protein